jgi:hypothetical protein
MYDDLEKRVSDLEREIVQLKEQIASLQDTDWRSTVGIFANGGPEVDEAIKLGREYREQQNREIE